MTLADLIARVEMLEGPDRVLDRDVGLAIGGWTQVYLGPLGTLEVPGEGSYPDHPGAMYPALTESLDAVIALTERVLPGAWYLLGKGRMAASEPMFGAQILFGSEEVIGEGEHNASLPIALLLATLRAKQAMEGGDAN